MLTPHPASLSVSWYFKEEECEFLYLQLRAVNFKKGASNAQSDGMVKFDGGFIFNHFFLALVIIRKEGGQVQSIFAILR